MLTEILIWFEANISTLQLEVVGGILTAVLVLSGQIFILVARDFIGLFIGRIGGSRRVFNLKMVQGSVYVISGSLKNSSPLIKGPDAKAATRIIAILELLYPKKKIIDESRGKTQATNIPQHDLISVGGPINNPITRSILSAFQVDLKFLEDDSLYIDDANIFTPKEYGDYSEDYGLLIRTKNPFFRENTAIVVAGCGTYGVYAAGLILSGSVRKTPLFKEFNKKRSSKDKVINSDFISVVKCKYIGDNIYDTEIVYQKTISS